jgi:hypothetical protein
MFVYYGTKYMDFFSVNAFLDEVHEGLANNDAEYEKYINPFMIIKAIKNGGHF